MKTFQHLLLSVVKVFQFQSSLAREIVFTLGGENFVTSQALKCRINKTSSRVDSSLELHPIKRNDSAYAINHTFSHHQKNLFVSLSIFCFFSFVDKLFRMI